ESISDVTHENLLVATGSTTRTTNIEEFLLSQRTSFPKHQGHEDSISALKPKSNNLIEELLKRKVDIIGLSETKLSQENQSAGVLLLICKNIKRYIAPIDKIDEYLITINLLNRGYKTWIVQIYLSSDRKKGQILQKKIQDLLQTYLQKNYEVIIIGDFNAIVDPRTDHKSTDTIREFVKSSEPESKLFQYMTNWNLIDLQNLWEPIDTTYI
ncbi:17757_t:CDS:2, partial [Acaulospora morrowiae]